MWLRPYSLARRYTRRHDSVSVGGCPVRGNTQHSRVPRREIRRPFRWMRLFFTSISRRPKRRAAVSVIPRPLGPPGVPPSHPPTMPPRVMVIAVSAGENSSQGRSAGLNRSSRWTVIPSGGTRIGVFLPQSWISRPDIAVVISTSRPVAFPIDTRSTAVRRSTDGKTASS